MGLRRSLATVLTLVLTVVLTASACGTNAVSHSGGGHGYKYKIAVVTHGSIEDPFWNIVKTGAVQAGKDMGDNVIYSSDGDPTRQAKLIDAAVNQKVDALVISMANPEALKAAIQRAIAAGIQLITINSGEAQSKSYGALSHIGSDEPTSGKLVGTELQKRGVKHVLCVVHEAGNIGLGQRCEGIRATLGGTVTNLQVDIKDLSQAQSILRAKLESDTTIDAVVTLNAQVAIFATGAIAGAQSNAKLATFDLSSDVAQAIDKGTIEFAVDQQPYLEGYLAVVMLTQYKFNLNVLGGGQKVLTGPNLITKDNAAQILKLIRGGTW